MRLMAPEGGRAVRLLALAGAAGLVAYLAQSLAPALCGDAVTAFAEAVLYPALVAVGGVLAAIRARARARPARVGRRRRRHARLGGRRRGRRARRRRGRRARPSPTCCGWPFYPAAYLTLMLLVRSRLADGAPPCGWTALLAALAVAPSRGRRVGARVSAPASWPARSRSTSPTSWATCCCSASPPPRSC